MKRQEVSEWNKQVGILFPSGLIVIILIIAQSYISSSNLKLPEVIALIAFAIALPQLVLIIIHLRHAFTIDYFPDTKTTHLLGIIAVSSEIIAVIGINAALWGISWIIGVIFLISAIFALIMYYIAGDELHEIENKIDSQKRSNLDNTPLLP